MKTSLANIHGNFEVFLKLPFERIMPHSVQSAKLANFGDFARALRMCTSAELRSLGQAKNEPIAVRRHSFAAQIYPNNWSQSCLHCASNKLWLAEASPKRGVCALACQRPPEAVRIHVPGRKIRTYSAAVIAFSCDGCSGGRRLSSERPNWEPAEVAEVPRRLLYEL